MKPIREQFTDFKWYFLIHGDGLINCSHFRSIGKQKGKDNKRQTALMYALTRKKILFYWIEIGKMIKGKRSTTSILYPYSY